MGNTPTEATAPKAEKVELTLEDKLAQAVKEREETLKKEEIAKKPFVQKIEKAELALAEAKEMVALANKKAQKLIDEAVEQGNYLIKAARQKVAEAAEDRYEAISNYQEQFKKPFTRQVTGAEAARELNGFLTEANNMLTSLFRGF